MNARGYEQVDGVHYADENYKAAPRMASEIVMQMAIVLIVMAKWMVHGLIEWSTCVWDCLACDMKEGVDRIYRGIRNHRSSCYAAIPPSPGRLAVNSA
jgi:hypothetical protein